MNNELEGLRAQLRELRASHLNESAALQAHNRRLEIERNEARAQAERERRSNGTLALELLEARAKLAESEETAFGAMDACTEAGMRNMELHEAIAKLRAEVHEYEARQALVWQLGREMRAEIDQSKEGNPTRRALERLFEHYRQVLEVPAEPVEGDAEEGEPSAGDYVATPVLVTREMAEAHYEAGGALEFTLGKRRQRRRVSTRDFRHQWREIENDTWGDWRILPDELAWRFEEEPGFYTLLPIEPAQQPEGVIARDCGAE